MSTLKVIFDFILSVVKVFFPGKNNGRHSHPDHPVPECHCPDRPAPEGDGSSPGSSGSHPVDSETGETTAETEDAPEPDQPVAADRSGRLMGQALILVAIASYLYKMVHY